MTLNLTREQAELVARTMRAHAAALPQVLEKITPEFTERYSDIADEIERQVKDDLQAQFPCVDVSLAHAEVVPASVVKLAEACEQGKIVTGGMQSGKTWAVKIAAAKDIKPLVDEIAPAPTKEQWLLLVKPTPEQLDKLAEALRDQPGSIITEPCDTITKTPPSQT